MKWNFLFQQLLSVAERLPHFFAEDAVGVGGGIIRNRLDFSQIDLSVFIENVFVRTRIDDFPNDVRAAVHVGAAFGETAFERERIFFEHRGVDVRTFENVQPGFRDLVRKLVSADDAEKVGYGFRLARTEAHRKGFALFDVFRCFVARTEANRDFVLFPLAAPRGVHRVDRSVFVVCGDDENGQRSDDGLGTEILSHKILLVADKV